MSLLSQITGGLMDGSRRIAANRRPAAPNLCAHLSAFCAIVPALVVLLAILFSQTHPNHLERIQRITGLLVPLITLVGAALGALGARCYWRDTRRGGIGLVALGLFGCGAWVIWYGSIFHALRKLL